ncbi:hypothetical protein ACP70R_031176 [Stipagrostis hirtigluma subsp. patula]
MALLNAGNNAPAAGGDGRRGLLPALPENVGAAVVVVGATTCITAGRALGAAAAAQPAYSRRALTAALFGGTAAMWAGVWVSAGGPRRRNAGLVILCVALVPFVVAAALGDFDPELAVNIYNALA